MKKILMVAIVLIASVLITSCTKSPQEKLISRTEEMVQEKLIPSLKDPKSFEKKDIKLDTVTTKEYLTRLMGFNLNQMKFNLELADIWIGSDNLKAKEYNDKVFSFKKTNDSLVSVINKTSDTSIYRVNIKYSYRAKNGFGALDIHTATFSYNPKCDELEYYND